MIKTEKRKRPKKNFNKTRSNPCGDESKKNTKNIRTKDVIIKDLCTAIKYFLNPKDNNLPETNKWAIKPKKTTSNLEYKNTNNPY